MNTPPEPASSDAPNWEYAEVEIAMANGPRASRLNGEAIPNWQSGPPWPTYLSNMTSQGWELMSQTQPTNSKPGKASLRREVTATPGDSVVMQPTGALGNV